jgi:tRNA (adenine22-N1)-methyltransferase
MQILHLLLLSIGGLPLRLKRVERLILDASAAQRGAALRCADVGCDHAALVIALCGAHDPLAPATLIGIDAAPLALAGAIANAHAAHLRALGGERNTFVRGVRSLELRVGDGLAALAAGEADVLTVSGVGVRTTFEILAHDDALHGECGAALRSRGIRSLVLQPGANPRPTALRALRSFVRAAGFDPTTERIDQIGGRFYLTLAFAARAEGDSPPPTSRESALLGCARAWPLREQTQYVRHHANWLANDLEHMGRWGDARRWGDRVGVGVGVGLGDASDEARYRDRLDGVDDATAFTELVTRSDLLELRRVAGGDQL